MGRKKVLVDKRIKSIPRWDIMSKLITCNEARESENESYKAD